MAASLNYQLQVSSGPLALANNTTTLATFTTPNDGADHMVTIGVKVVVTSDETGGAINAVVAGTTVALVAAAKAAANSPYPGGTTMLVPPNTAVTIVPTALSGGASTVSIEIWSN